MINKPAPRLILYILIVFILLAVNSQVVAESIKIAIVAPDSLKTTQRTARGIKGTIEERFASVTFREFVLSSDKAANDKLIESLRQFNPRLIMTVGSSATEMVSSIITDRPIVFSAVLNPQTSGFVQTLDKPGGNITGASLDIPPDIQFKYFRRVIKNLKSIGVLYTKETENLIPPARALAKQSGLELVAIMVETEKQIPKALDSLAKVVDGLWSVADFNIYSPQTTRFILLNTLRNGKPFMGFSKNLVESGALFGLDYDYKDIGRQAGNIACEILSGKPPATISVAVPSVIWFNYNEKTASHIKIAIPEDLAAVAKEVYK